MRARFVVGGVAAAVLLLVAAGTGTAAQSSASQAQARAIQSQRDAARSAERSDAAKIRASAAAQAAAAAYAKAQRTHSFHDVANAASARATAARLGAVAAQARLAAAAKTASPNSVSDQTPGGADNAGTIDHTTDGTVANAVRDAKQACDKAAQDAAEVVNVQAQLAAAQASTHPNAAKIAALQAKLATKTAQAAASAAACTAANDNAAKETASFAGYSDGTSVEGTTVIPETEPTPDADYLSSCPTTTGPTTPCTSDNVQLVSHTGGYKTGGSPSCPAFNPTKCPGFSSMNFVEGYKHLGYDFAIANGTSGLSVWSLKDPGHPALISDIPFTSLVAGLSGAAGTQFWEGENETVDSARKLVFMSRDVGVKGLFIIDLKDPWHPAIIGFQKVPQGHTATCLNGCRFIWSVGGVASGSGAGFTSKSAPVSVTDIRDPAHPFTYTTAVQANVQRSNSTSGSTHSVDVDFNGVAWVSASSGVRGYWTSGKHYDPVSNSQKWATPYAPLPYAGGRIDSQTSSFMHNAYHFPTSLNGGPAGDVLLVTNENNNTNCASAGVFILAGLAGTYDDHGLVVRSPNTLPQMTRYATFSVNGKPGQFHGVSGTTQVGDCSSHWFTVRGNLVAAAFYEQGLRIIDVSNPAAPVQVGYGRVPVRAAAPGVPAIIQSQPSAAYWHGNYIYESDYERGMDVWKYTGPIPGVIQKKTCWNSCEK